MLVFVFTVIFYSICQHTTSRLCPTNRDADDLWNICLPAGGPLVMHCPLPGNSLTVNMGANEANGCRPMKIENHEGCSYWMPNSACSYMRKSEHRYDLSRELIKKLDRRVFFSDEYEKVDNRTLEYYDFTQKTSLEIKTKPTTDMWIESEENGVWTSTAEK